MGRLLADDEIRANAARLAVDLAAYDPDLIIPGHGRDRRGLSSRSRSSTMARIWRAGLA
jgi:hypothetical protein